MRIEWLWVGLLAIVFTLLVGAGMRPGAQLAGAFPGEARWMDIVVKCPGDAVFTPFPERQAPPAAPYALYARATGTAESALWGGQYVVMEGNCLLLGQE